MASLHVILKRVFYIRGSVMNQRMRITSCESIELENVVVQCKDFNYLQVQKIVKREIIQVYVYEASGSFYFPHFPSVYTLFLAHLC